VIVKLTVDLIWYLPSWLIIVLAVELFAVSGILKQTGITDKVKDMGKMVKTEAKKIFDKIPKYECK
jgi:hypothetical protein